MTEEEYLEFVRTCTYVNNHIPLWIYAGLGIGGEAGEVVDEIKKAVRKLKDNSFPVERLEKVKLELGDVLFYINMLCSELNLSMDDLRKSNVNKLSERYKTEKPELYQKLLEKGIQS